MKITNTFWANIIHVAVQGAVWIIPVLIAAHPEWQTMTVSGLLSMFVSWANNQYHTLNSA